MAEVDLSKLADRAQDAAEPIKRTVERTTRPNPLQPVLADSWEHRSTRDGSKSEVGKTKQLRSYSAAETLAIVRALRRASDALGVGVRIEAPHDAIAEPVYEKDADGNATSTQATDEQGNPITRTKLNYKAGTIRFEAVTRQKRERKQNGEQASTEQESTEESDGAAEDAPGQQDAEPAWS